ncbi:MAG TPA: hypothetical protein VEN81_12385 [Planctomycetota bacterium]|nr:hypothetical protein [Planctomycetota bacterium]
MDPSTREDRLSPEKMQLFLAGLQGMPPEEVRKAKVLYLRNAISEYHAANSKAQAFSKVLPGGCLFGSGRFNRMARQVMGTELRLQEERIHNAMEVWKDDLKGERFDF